MTNPTVIFDNLPITDWIQAVGAVIAIIAAVIGFCKLFKRDTDKQRQIESLARLAEQSEIQSNQLINFAEYLNQSNVLLTEQVSLIQEIVKVSEKDQTTTQLRVENEAKMRKLQNLPRFEYAHGMGNINSFTLDLVNKGKIGKVISIEELMEDNNTNIQLLTAIDTLIDQNDKIRIRITPKETIKSLQSAQLNFNLHFSDIEENHYIQHIHGIALKPKVNFPFEFIQ
jgi:hypothetical protein